MLDILVHEQEPVVEEDKPPSRRPRPARPWRVAVIANVKGDLSLPEDAPADAGAEYDKPETIQAIQKAIESDGHHSIFIPADSNLPVAIREFCPDICFNIAEGQGGDGREAQVPALLEMMHIPYTASRVVANAVSLDKTMTKRLWRDQGLPTAPFQEFATGDEPLSPALRFPMFVKPAREGTGMGMGSDSIVHDEMQLRRQVRWVLREYNQPALVEAFLPGREFTIAVLGRKDAREFGRNPDLYNHDGYHWFPALEVVSSKSVTPGVYGNKAKSLYFGEDGIPEFPCPANITPELHAELCSLAIQAHESIGSLDVSRVDFRMDSEGKPCLIEINTLPGLSPGFSDLCVIANADGISYQDLILEILYLGASRYGLLEKVPAVQVERWPHLIPSLPFARTSLLLY